MRAIFAAVIAVVMLSAVVGLASVLWLIWSGGVVALKLLFTSALIFVVGGYVAFAMDATGANR